MGDIRTDPYWKRVFTGQLAGLVSGTAYQLPAVDGERAILVAHPSNSGVVWVGFQSGTVNNTTGMPLAAGGIGLPFEGLADLSLLWANFDVAGDRVCWMMFEDDPGSLGAT